MNNGNCNNNVATYRISPNINTECLRAILGRALQFEMSKGKSEKYFSQTNKTIVHENNT